MRIHRFLICAVLLLSATVLYSDEAEEIRKKLPKLQGEKKLAALGRLHDLSRENDDYNQQLTCLYAHLNEARRQGNVEEQCADLLSRGILFYNYDLDDSLFYYVRGDMQFLAKHEQWEMCYRLWFSLANTYVYSDSLATGLKEAQTMYEDAKQHQDVQGQGLAYLAMGNAYFNMHNMEEANEAYHKAIDQLMTLRPLPREVPMLFSSRCDVLERIQAYQQLASLQHNGKKLLSKLSRIINSQPIFPERYRIGHIIISDALRLHLAYNRMKRLQRCLLKPGNVFLAKRTKHSVHGCFTTRNSANSVVSMAKLLYNTQLLRLVEGVDDKAELIRVKQQRAEIMTGMGKDKIAAELYREIYLISDSVNIKDTKRQLAEMNARFNVDELEMKQARLKMEQAQQQRLGIIIIASIIVTSLVIFIYFRLRSAKRLKIAHTELEKTHSELLTAYDQLEETTAAKERIESDLRIARDIQRSMVPSTFPDRPDLDIYASMTPAKEVGGDLYGYLLQDDKLYFALGDVSGKGVPASLFMAQATRLFRTLAAQQMMPAEICTRINDALSGEDNEAGMFVTMFMGLVDLKTGHLDFCNAGHNPPVLVESGKAAFIEMLPNAPIGLWPGMQYEGEELQSIMDKPLFVYSDGLNEAENRQQEQFSDERLVEILEKTPFESSKQMIELLSTEVEKHRDGAEPNDDLTMLCVRVLRT